jgi:hypothetical protein
MAARWQGSPSMEITFSCNYFLALKAKQTQPISAATFFRAIKKRKNVFLHRLHFYICLPHLFKVFPPEKLAATAIQWGKFFLWWKSFRANRLRVADNFRTCLSTHFLTPVASKIFQIFISVNRIYCQKVYVCTFAHFGGYFHSDVYSCVFCHKWSLLYFSLPPVILYLCSLAVLTRRDSICHTYVVIGTLYLSYIDTPS